MRALLCVLWALVTWPLAVVQSYRARRRLRGYAGSQSGALTVRRVA
jgi:hypothetical protein